MAATFTYFLAHSVMNAKIKKGKIKNRLFGTLIHSCLF